ncbi:MAG TPA: hypothetical protein VLV83_07480 [Acidobacteriota bacterium]|nr:hypothetical protein [Acidobacteriota bacterium]
MSDFDHRLQELLDYADAHGLDEERVILNAWKGARLGGAQPVLMARVAAFAQEMMDLIKSEQVTH